MASTSDACRKNNIAKLPKKAYPTALKFHIRKGMPYIINQRNHNNYIASVSLQRTPNIVACMALIRTAQNHCTHCDVWFLTSCRELLSVYKQRA